MNFESELRVNINKEELKSFLRANHQNYDDFKELESVLEDSGLILSFNPEYNTFGIKSKKGYNYNIVFVLNSIKTLKDKNLILGFTFLGLNFNQYVNTKYLDSNILNTLKVNGIYKAYINSFGVQIYKKL